MQEVWAIFQTLINGLSLNEAVFMVASVAGILLLTQLLKFPVKKFLTSKMKTEALRKKVNTVFMVLPLVIGSAEGIVCQQLGYLFTQADGISCGVMAVYLFGIVDRLLKGDGAKQLKEILADAKNDVTSAKKEFDEAISKILNK